MNAHLNIFKTYTKENRLFQLENDLTRAFAICMQEDVLFFSEVLKSILDSKYADELFNDLDNVSNIAINIQKNSSEIRAFEKVYAVSLSEQPMNEPNFWAQLHQVLYDPICDIVIQIDGIVVIIEAKRDNVDCTAQLYNQAYNICNKANISDDSLQVTIVPRDLNWPKLMAIAVKVLSFEKAAGVANRFLNDFIELVKIHNFRWLPEPAICAISPYNKKAIERRLASAVAELSKGGKYISLAYQDRLGLLFEKPWAQEILFDVHDNGDLHIKVYPGNTKGQGALLFEKDPKPKLMLEVQGKSYNLNMLYHIKLTSFQKFFAGLWFSDKELTKPLYTSANFWHYTGRKKRGTEWDALEKLFDEHFDKSYDWKFKCKWDAQVINSGRNQFDISFGYEFCLVIPFEELKNIDRERTDISGLTQLLASAYTALETLYDA